MLNLPLVFLAVFITFPKTTEVIAEGQKISFTPLPKAESYKLDGWNVNSWSLSGLVDISSGIALLVKPNAPYGMYAQTSRYAIVLIYTHVVYKDERTNVIVALYFEVGRMEHHMQLPKIIIQFEFVFLLVENYKGYRIMATCQGFLNPKIIEKMLCSWSQLRFFLLVKHLLHLP